MLRSGAGRGRGRIEGEGFLNGKTKTAVVRKGRRCRCGETFFVFFFVWTDVVLISAGSKMLVLRRMAKWANCFGITFKRQEADTI